MGVFDWLDQKRRERAVAAPWQVHREADELVLQDPRGKLRRVALGGARAVRIVPLTQGTHHRQGAAWQVALQHADGDDLLGEPIADWRVARDLANQVRQATDLPFDQLSERMFSQVGRFTPTQDA